MMTTATRSVEENGAAVTPAQTAPTSSRRRCLVCGERLSSYNTGETCFAHTVGVPWKGPNNRP